MKKIYITVLLVFIVSLFLFLISFVYLDKHNHKTFYYDISLGGQYVGTAKIDKFVTEDKLVYRSVSTTPFREFFTEERTRLDLDTRYNLEDYQKELFANGVAHLFYAEDKNDSASFLSRSISRFNYLGNLPVRKDVYIFELSSPITYLPIIGSYDFGRGKSQGFNSFIYLSDRQLPPVKRFVTLTSIKDEYLKINHRRIKTENLLLKIRGCPPGSVWVAKSDRSIIMIEIPLIGLKITRSFNLKEASPKGYLAATDGYISKDVTFHSKHKQLSGTITTPSSETLSPDSKFPAVLLVWGAGPQDRDYQGFFASIAGYLSKNGYAVLRFDKRGLGPGRPDTFFATPEDEFTDLTAALNFLASQKNVDAMRISIISHSEGAVNALRLAADNPDIKGLILMAPLIKLGPEDSEALLRYQAAKEKWGDEYLKLALQSIQETRERANGTKHDWGYIMGRRCYLKGIRDEYAFKPMEILEKISAPILILHGKDDAEVPVEYAAALDKNLFDYGKMKHTITYFGYLGHFFGKIINDGQSRMHYDVDKDVLAGIRDWLNINNVAAPSNPEADVTP